MEVRVTHHVDESEPDEDGRYEYRYAYSVHAFSDARTTYVVRSYDDEPTEAHFLRAEQDGSTRGLRPDDLTSPLFIDAVQYLRAGGKTRLRWFRSDGDVGYVPLAE